MQNKNKRGRERKVINHLEPFFFHTLEDSETSKQNIQVMQNKNKRGRERKVINHLEPFFFHTLEDPFL